MTIHCQGCYGDGFTGACTEPTTHTPIMDLSDRELLAELAAIDEQVHADILAGADQSRSTTVRMEAWRRSYRQQRLIDEARKRCPIDSTLGTYLTVADVDALIERAESDDPPPWGQKRLESLLRIRLALQFNNAAQVTLIVAE